MVGGGGARIGSSGLSLDVVICGKGYAATVLVGEVCFTSEEAFDVFVVAVVTVSPVFDGASTVARVSCVPRHFTSSAPTWTVYQPRFASRTVPGTVVVAALCDDASFDIGSTTVTPSPICHVENKAVVVVVAVVPARRCLLCRCSRPPAWSVVLSAATVSDSDRPLADDGETLVHDPRWSMQVVGEHFCSERLLPLFLFSRFALFAMIPP